MIVYSLIILVVGDSQLLKMATSAVVSEDLNSYPVKCGSCLQDEGYIINPKRLPCGHTFCATCLTDGQENIQVIVCRDCKYVLILLSNIYSVSILFLHRVKS